MKDLKIATYRAVDAMLLGRGVRRSINGDHVRFPARWARFYASVYEPAKHRFLTEGLRSGDHAIDVGAHIGLFTVLMARRVDQEGRVVAFEPNTETRQVLSDVVSLNNVARRVTVLPKAAGRTTGHEPFYRTGFPASNSDSLVRDSVRHQQERLVPVTTIDAVVTEQGLRPACIKIDAEGAELDILVGALRTLETYRPALAVEIHPNVLANAGQTSEEIFGLLDELGYRIDSTRQRVEPGSLDSRAQPFEIQAVIS